MGLLNRKNKQQGILFPEGLVLDPNRSDWVEVGDFLTKQLNTENEDQLRKLIMENGKYPFVDFGLSSAFANTSPLVCWGEIVLEPPTFTKKSQPARIEIGKTAFCIFWNAKRFGITDYVSVQWSDVVGAQWKSPLEMEFMLNNSRYEIGEGHGFLPECRLTLTFPGNQNPFDNRRSFAAFTALRHFAKKQLSPNK